MFIFLLRLTSGGGIEEIVSYLEARFTYIYISTRYPGDKIELLVCTAHETAFTFLWHPVFSTIFTTVKGQTPVLSDQ